MIHSFNTEVAAQCGILAATIFGHICFWCDHNERNQLNYHDGRYWTFNSKKAFAEQFYYCSEKQVRTALQTLKDAGLIETGCYNKIPYDRTLWYAVSDKGEQYNDRRCRDRAFPLALQGQWVSPTGPMGQPHGANESAPQGQPIPDNNTDNNADNNTNRNNEYTNAPKGKSRTREEKATFGEYKNVKLSATEYEKLKETYGEAETQKAIDYLDAYIEEKGKKYKNHYLTLRRWVFDALRERSQRHPQGGYNWEAL